MNRHTEAFGLFAFVCMMATAARADENGVPKYSPAVKCPATPSMAMDFICTALGAVGGKCQTTADTCLDAEQELFSGLDTELAMPKNIKPWTGFGAGGAFYSAATLCLVKDLDTWPMVSHAEASVLLGTFSVDQQVLFTNWDKTTHAVSGVQTARVCGPVVGCLDAYQQSFTLTPVTQTVSGQNVGGYKVLATQSLVLSTKGINQGLLVALPAFQVVTPYGSIEAKPAFSVKRSVGWILAPFNGGNLKSMIPMNTASGTFNMRALDLYGRWPGLSHSQSVPYKSSSGGWYPTNDAWISQAALGGRSGLPTADTWIVPAGVEYPSRPDLPLGDKLGPRLDAEHIPNAGLMAAVKISYSPVDLIPDWIRNSSFIDLNFDIFVTPNVEVGAATQLDFWTAEAAHWKGQYNNPTLATPAPTVTPPDLVSQHQFHMFAGTSAAARFALDAGVDLRIVLNIPLLFKTLHKTIIDIHPTTTVAEKIDEGRHSAGNSASFLVDSVAFASSGKFFSKYHTLGGSEPEGMSHIKMCLAQPSASKPPPTPSYTPGNPADLTQGLQMPCNICVGMADQTFETQKKGEPLHTVTIKGFLTTIKPTSQAAKPASARWMCDSLAKVGCYDMCTVDKGGATMTVAETAREMLASGKMQGHGARLMCQ